MKEVISNDWRSPHLANDVEIVQTFSRLNRMAPGKDEVFITDFVNDPENVRRAFAMYDDGAQIDDVQDLNVVYEIKDLSHKGLRGATAAAAIRINQRCLQLLAASAASAIASTTPASSPTAGARRSSSCG